MMEYEGKNIQELQQVALQLLQRPRVCASDQMESVMAAIHWLATREQAGERLIISLAHFEETK